MAALGAVALAVYLPMLWKRPVKRSHAATRARVDEEARPRPAARPQGSSGEPMKPEAARPPAPSFEGLFEPGRSAAAAAPLPEPRVSSILRFGRERRAVVDGRVVRPGDRVGAHRVEEIGEAEVVLRAGKDVLLVPLVAPAPPPAEGGAAERKRKP